MRHPLRPQHPARTVRAIRQGMNHPSVQPHFDVWQRYEGTPKQKRLIRQWGNRPGRPWMTGELVEARSMRQLGAASEEIARHLNRTTRSVDAKLGHKGPRGSHCVRAGTW
jgi:hypothetical protein